LWLAAVEGDGAAFAALVRPHLALLHRIAARASHAALAEDAVQETLSIAFRQLRSFRPGTSFKAFLAGIAVRRAHTLLRSERRRRLREDAATLPARADTPEEILRAAEGARRVQQALAAMQKKRRAAALLRLDGGLSYDEIATALDTSQGSARVLVHLALGELAERLGDLLRGVP
jgi:RNA polymerase sigma-70 factor (ECF subfamily)